MLPAFLHEHRRNAVRILATAALALGLLMGGAAQAEEVTHVYQGRTLVAELTLAPGKAVKDGVILMVHGTLGHKDMEIMKSLRELLQKRGQSTLAINLSLGQSNRRGMYDCAVPHRHKHTEALTDIGVWLTWLKDEGATAVTLLGHSRGANQVSWYAFERSVPLVRSLILLAPMTWNPDREAAAYKAQYGVDLKSALKPAERMVGVGRGHEMLQDVGFLNCPKATVAAGALVDYYIFDQRRDTPTLLPGLHRPILVVTGSEDPATPELLEKLKRLELPHVQVNVVQGADHFFRDLNAEEVADIVAEFMAKLPPPPAK